MSKVIKVEEQVYDQLDKLKARGETFSQVIGDLLGARLQIFRLLDVLEGQLKFREWQRERLEAQK